MWTSAKMHPAPFWFCSHWPNVPDLSMTSFYTFFANQDICSLSPTSPPASCSSISWSWEVAPPRAFRPTDNRDSIFFPCHDLHLLNITKGGFIERTHAETCILITSENWVLTDIEITEVLKRSLFHSNPFFGKFGPSLGVLPVVKLWGWREVDTCREVVKLVAKIQSLSGDTKMNRVVSARTSDNHTGFKRDQTDPSAMQCSSIIVSQHHS